jgi:hypothetical protein
MDQRWGSSSQDVDELLSVGLGSQNREDVIDERLSFPHTPNLSLLNSCISIAVADRYLFMHTSGITADLLLFFQSKGFAARPWTRLKCKDGVRELGKDTDGTPRLELPECIGDGLTRYAEFLDQA